MVSSIEGAPLGACAVPTIWTRCSSALTRAVDQHHPGVPQRLTHRTLSVPRQQPVERRPRDGCHLANMPPTMVNAYPAAKSVRILPLRWCAFCR